MKPAASVGVSEAEHAPVEHAPSVVGWAERARAALSRFAIHRVRSRRMPAETPANFTTETKDAELTITAVRTVVLLAALAVPSLLEDSPGYRSEEIWLAAVAGIYNMAAGLSCLWPSRYGLRRPFILAMDMMLITFWVHVSRQWELFPFYYIVVVMAAMWFRVFGGIVAAAFCNFFFLFLWGHAAADEMMASIMVFTTAMAINSTLLFLVGCLVGFIAEAQERERQHRLESQLLIANYQREIDISSQLQPLLISPDWVEGASTGSPATFPITQIDPTLEIGAAMKLARLAGGGDYFDLISLEGGCTALCIADVAGKSVRAQARIPLLKYSLRALAPLYPQPDVLVKRLNETLAPDLQPELFIGLCYIVLDPRHQTLTWCNAGHVAPLLISQGQAQPDKTAQIETTVTGLETMGPALGMFPGMAYTARSLPWRPSDQLLLFTDGLADALDDAEGADGEDEVERLAAQLAVASHDARPTARAIAQALLDTAVATLDQPRRLAHFLSRLGTPDTGANGSPVDSVAAYRDDITVVVVRYKTEELSPHEYSH
jgi:serine phosphatase RsbU (regulator of sigma subunit)